MNRGTNRKTEIRLPPEPTRRGSAEGTRDLERGYETGEEERCRFWRRAALFLLFSPFPSLTHVRPSASPPAHGHRPRARRDRAPTARKSRGTRTLVRPMSASERRQGTSAGKWSSTSSQAADDMQDSARSFEQFLQKSIPRSSSQIAQERTPFYRAFATPKTAAHWSDATSSKSARLRGALRSSKRARSSSAHQLCPTSERA